MKRIILYMILLLVCHGGVTFSQNKDTLLPANNWVVLTIPVPAKDIRIHDKSIVPGTFNVEGISKTWYSIDDGTATFRWKGPIINDSIRIRFRSFPFLLPEKTNHLSYDSVRYNFMTSSNPFVLTNREQTDAPIFDWRGLETEGSIGRAISFGNNRDANLNSTLNLQLNGFIGDSMEITAAITDNTIPIQPDGNTRDLRDLDRIFIQLKKKEWSLSMGDLDLKEKELFGLTFYKRIQGGMYQTRFKASEKVNAELEFAGSIAKGKFTRNFIKPLEGNQGPYRLQGANNEIYFVVLAGTEKVFIDGIRMERGEDQDYVINYNTAEISFTPKQQITKDKRIQVEFEYADRKFLNTQLFLKNKWHLGKKINVNLGYFSNTDITTSPIDQVLGENEKNFLASIGDSIQNAFVENIVRDTFATDKILYKKIDTFSNGSPITIYKYSPTSADSLYQLNFTYLGAGKGNYKQDPNIANGKVFIWVSPDQTGSKQGDYEPVRFLVTPKKLSLLSVGLNWELSPKSKIQMNWAQSNYDVNRFSSNDKSNNAGQAISIQSEWKSDSFEFAKNEHVLELKTKGEWVQQSFRSPERLRSAEFYRDWGLETDLGFDQEKWVSAALSLLGKQNGKTGYQFELFERGSDINAARHQFNLQSQYKGWKWSSNSSWLMYQQGLRSGRFLRPNFDVKKQWKFRKTYETGLNYQLEQNIATFKNSDSLSLNSFEFDRWEFYIKSDPQQQNKWGFTYFSRTDKLPDQNKMSRVDRSHNYQFSMELLSNPKRQWKHTIGFRKLDVFNENISKQKPGKTLLTRAEYYFNEWNGGMNGSMLYEIGGGQEQKRAVSYLAVPVGQGNFTWIDYNNNGIEELNEFEAAQFQDQRKYIQVFTPTNEFIATQYVQWNANMDIQPDLLLGERKGHFANILRKTQLNSIIQLSKKRTSSNSFFFDPLQGNDADTALISSGKNISNSLFFNRTSTKWGFDINQSLISSKSLLTYGKEINSLDQWSVRIRWNINRKFNINVFTKTAKQGLKNTASNFGNRNYELSQQWLEPQLVYLKANRLRVVLAYSFGKKTNLSNRENNTLSQSMRFEAKYNTPSSLSVNGSFRYQFFNYSAGGNQPGSSVGFIMLEGLQPGRNLIWQLDLTKRVSGNIECNFQYNARQSEKTRTIHLGSASVRVLF